MQRRGALLFWFEVVLACASGVSLALTLVRREWIELVFGVEPDGGSGTAEWLVALALAAATVAFSAFARRQRRRLVAVAAAAGRP